MRSLTYVKAINEGLHLAMEKDPKVISYGLGIDDPRRIFTSTEGLVEAFGNDRVFDMPTSENAMTGVAIGASLNGYKPVMVHQRLDFFLLALDQLVNNAAKWRFIYGGQNSVPITIRLIIGRGWGQGPTHSQSLQSWFAHIPGIKVLMPAFPEDAKSLLLSAIEDPNPVVFLEHRWLHNQSGEVTEGYSKKPIGPADILSEGDDFTLVSYSYMTIEALKAMEYLKKFDIKPELINLSSLSPIDWETIRKSVRKTKKLMVLETAADSFSVGSEIVSKISIDEFDSLNSAPIKVALPDFPIPTSQSLTENFYKTSYHVIKETEKLLSKDLQAEDHKESITGPHDVPGDWFKGPF